MRVTSALQRLMLTNQYLFSYIVEYKSVKLLLLCFVQGGYDMKYVLAKSSNILKSCCRTKSSDFTWYGAIRLNRLDNLNMTILYIDYIFLLRRHEDIPLLKHLTTERLSKWFYSFALKWKGLSMFFHRCLIILRIKVDKAEKREMKKG